MLTVTEAYEIAAEMMDRLPKPTLAILVEGISGGTWDGEADNAHHHIAGLLLESAGLPVVRDSSTGEILSARGA